jgi:hypothetical protein
MMRYYRRLVILIALVSSGASAQRGGEPFLNMYVEPTTGRVGYHFTAHYFVPNPPGYRSGECGASANRISIRGEPPPGIVFNSSAVDLFSGTPRQPGTWRIQLDIFGIRCTRGRDQRPYDRTILVTFRIEP